MYIFFVTLLCYIFITRNKSQKKTIFNVLINRKQMPKQRNKLITGAIVFITPCPSNTPMNTIVKKYSINIYIPNTFKKYYTPSSIVHYGTIII